MGKLFWDVYDRVELKNGVVLGGYRVKRDFKNVGDVTAGLNDDKNNLVKRDQQWLQEQSLWGGRGTKLFLFLRDV